MRPQERGVASGVLARAVIKGTKVKAMGRKYLGFNQLLRAYEQKSIRQIHMASYIFSIMAHLTCRESLFKKQNASFGLYKGQSYFDSLTLPSKMSLLLATGSFDKQWRGSPLNTGDPETLFASTLPPRFYQQYLIYKRGGAKSSFLSSLTTEATMPEAKKKINSTFMLLRDQLEEKAGAHTLPTAPIGIEKNVDALITYPMVH